MPAFRSDVVCVVPSSKVRVNVPAVALTRTVSISSALLPSRLVATSTPPAVRFVTSAVICATLVWATPEPNVTV